MGYPIGFFQKVTVGPDFIKGPEANPVSPAPFNMKIEKTVSAVQHFGLPEWGKIQKPEHRLKVGRG
jgi:hypothetical protein